jgi:hypothetical protein
MPKNLTLDYIKRHKKEIGREFLRPYPQIVARIPSMQQWSAHWEKLGDEDESSQVDAGTILIKYWIQRNLDNNFISPIGMRSIVKKEVLDSEPGQYVVSISVKGLAGELVLYQNNVDSTIDTNFFPIDSRILVVRRILIAPSKALPAHRTGHTSDSCSLFDRLQLLDVIETLN